MKGTATLSTCRPNTVKELASTMRIYPTIPPLSPRDVERFWRRVVKTETCWLWTGLLQDGYGRFFLSTQQRNHRQAHRVAYHLLVGEVVTTLQIDHLCRVRHCVNPAHLELVTPWVNTMRGKSFSAVNAGATHCVHGHPFDTTNTGYNRGWRVCRECRRRRQAMARRRK